MNFPHTATIQTLVQAGTKFTYTTGTTTECFLQPLDTQSATDYSITLTKGFACYLPFASTVAEKQRLIIDGTTYSVRGVRTHNYGRLKHKKAILELLS